MMSKIRTAAKPVYVVVIIAFVGTIIFAWGMDITSKDKRSPNIIGKINDSEISIETFYRAYEDKYREFIKTNNDPTDDDIKNLRNQTWNSIVGQIILSQQIMENDINMTQRELAEYVRNVPLADLRGAEEMQTDGKFDPLKYQNYLQELATSPDPRAEQMLLMIENSTKSQMLISKLQEFVISTAFVNKTDVYEQYRENNEKVKVRYAFISENNIDTANLEIPDEALLAKYEEDKEIRYKTGETATLKYISFNKEPSEIDLDSIKSEIYKLQDRLKNGENFETLAEKYSKDNSGQNGGDLGWFSKGKMVKPFEDAVFKLKKKGDISKPVKTQFGWHLIKLTDRKKEKNDKGEQEEQVRASHILLKTEISEATLDELHSEAERFIYKAQEKGFEEFARENNYRIQNTPSFPKDGMIPGIGNNPELVEFAFDAKDGSISDVIDTRNALLVATTDERRPAGFKPFDEVRRNEAFTDLAKGLTQIAAGAYGLKKGLAIDPEIATPDWESRIDRAIGKGKEKYKT